MTVGKVHTIAPQHPKIVYCIRVKGISNATHFKRRQYGCDFYSLKFADGTEHNRLAMKVVTFMGKTQSKRYINISDVKREVESRIEGYGYRQTRINVEAQLFNSALACAC